MSPTIRERIDGVFTAKLQPLGLTATLTFNKPTGEPTYNPATGKTTNPTTPVEVLGTVVAYDQGLVNGDVIQRGDLQAIVSDVAMAAAGVLPEAGMVVFYGLDADDEPVPWTIVSVTRYPVGEEVAAWDMQLRGT